MSVINPWLGIGLVLAILGVLLVALAHLSRRRHPEVVRKMLHVGMGSVTLSFPWLFAQVWPVVVLAGVSLLAFLCLRIHPAIGAWLGPAIHGVSRASLGEMYFVLGACVVFVLSMGDALLFCIPMLVLTLADAAAALIGTRFGRHPYAFNRGRKTLEGSAAFFVVALACVYLPLSWYASGNYLMVALTVAALATGIEAMSGRGLDNVLIPVGVFAMLTVNCFATGHSSCLVIWPDARTQLMA